MNITFYSTGAIFDRAHDTGGVKRFRELYSEFSKLGVNSILCSADDPFLTDLAGKKFYSLEQEKNTKHIFPQDYYNYRKNKKRIQELRNIPDNRVVVFDVPNCIGLVLARVPNIVLFIRQDLIGYKKIYLKEAGVNLFKRGFLFMLFWVSECFCFIKVRKMHVQCRYDLEVIKARHKILANTIERKTTVQINNVNPSWLVENRMKAQSLVPQPLFNNGYFTLGYVGDFSSNRKGYLLFVTVLKTLLEQGHKVNAILVGKGSHLEECKEQLITFKENVVFTGWVNNPAVYIRQCDLCVVPSFEDSCPNTVLEALYNEIPVIGANRGGIPEILVDCNALFEPTESDLYEKLVHYTNNNNIINLYNMQLKRKNELSFNWTEKVNEFLFQS